MRKLIRILTSLAVVATAAVAVTAVAPADAACSGINRGAYWDNWDYGAETIGSLRTCDGDDYYIGAVAEYGGSQGDGYCAVVRAIDDSSNASWVWLGYSCRNDDRFVTYHWNPDTSGGTMKLCKHWRWWDCSPTERSWGM